VLGFERLPQAEKRPAVLGVFLEVAPVDRFRFGGPLGVEDGTPTSIRVFDQLSFTTFQAAVLEGYNVTGCNGGPGPFVQGSIG
jgi:hypothetical protein